MSAERLLLSDKYKAFLRCDAPVEFLRAPRRLAKTTVGLFKFAQKLLNHPRSSTSWLRTIAGAAEKNIIQKDRGILDDFGILVEYKGNGGGGYNMPHYPLPYICR